MKQAELAHFRSMLQAQALEPERKGLFGSRSVAPAVTGLSKRDDTHAPPPPRPGASRFGRRPTEAEPPPSPAPLLLDRLAPTLATEAHLPLRAERHLAETPFHEEDLLDLPVPAGPRPGVIAGWSAEKPQSAQKRLLRRVGCVIEAERQGLNARLAVAGV